MKMHVIYFKNLILKYLRVLEVIIIPREICWAGFIALQKLYFSSFSKKKLEIFPIDEISSEDNILIQVDHDLLQEEEVLREIQNLPEGYRIILNMFVFDCMDHAAIADILGISESTSRSQLNRARNLLKRNWNYFTIQNMKKFHLIIG